MACMANQSCHTATEIWTRETRLEIAKVDAITALINHRADVNAVSGEMILSWIPGSYCILLTKLLYVTVRVAASQPFPR